jgi:hypothetical protein
LRLVSAWREISKSVISLRESSLPSAMSLRKTPLAAHLWCLL